MKKIIVITILLIALCGCSDGSKQKYDEALQCLESKDYDQAITLFQELGGYSDSAQQLIETKYRKAEQLFIEGQFSDAVALYKELGPYKNSPMNKRNALYMEAEDLFNSGNYQEAKDIFSILLGYKDSEEYLVKADIASIENAEIHAHVFFGKYEQDGIDGNGLEEIEWIVLDRQDNRVLLLSEYILENIPFNTENVTTTWESSSIRKWLNNDFYNIAFDETAKKYIGLTTVVPELSTWTSASNQGSAGETTNDYVFLLSISETEKYDQSGRLYYLRYAELTPHAGSFDEPAWWLRNTLNFKYNSGRIGHEAHYMQYNGNTEYRRTVSGESVLSSFIVGARPAIWVEIND